MGLFEHIRSSHTRQNVSSWQTIRSADDLERARKESYEKPVVLFKHSTSCGLSAGAKYRLESDWPELGHEIGFYYLDLLSYRSLSNQIASDYNVIHQSPQVIVVKNGKEVYNTSHHNISISDLRLHLDKIT